MASSRTQPGQTWPPRRSPSYARSDTATRRWRCGRPGVIAALLAVMPVATLAAPLGSAAQPGAASWLRYHANASNNAVIAAPGWRPVMWRSRPVKDQILGVSVVGDRVYAVGTGADHAVYAFDRTTGQLIWRRVLDNIVMTQPLVVGNRLFVGSGNN